MRKMKRWLCAALAACMLCACAAAEGGARVLRLAESFAYPSLDAHLEYYGWYTSIYGVTEALFRVADDSSVQPWLAEGAQVDEGGRLWTVTLKEDVCFSNGSALDAEMCVRNLERLAEKNPRFAHLANFAYEVLDARRFTIETPEVYPTLINELASPEAAMLDLDGTQDFDRAPVGTGPFVVARFEPEGTVEVARNERYWGGEVRLDGVVFYYMPDDESKLMAMQSGEIDGYDGVTAAALQILSNEPDCEIAVCPATRLQFYILNQNRLSDNLRAAINLAVDCEAIAAYLGGTTTAAVGPFGTETAYGQVTKPAPDAQAAREKIEAEGYELGADGYYARGGEALSLNICYYASRSLDSIALLMQEQLREVGVAATLTCEEDPDATYIATGDFDIALYCMIADSAGDPYYFINATLRDGAYYDCGGFDSDECEALIDELASETDAERRAELANQIVQIAIDDNAFGYVGLFNKITAMRSGVSGISETCPFDFYRVGADTDIA